MRRAAASVVVVLVFVLSALLAAPAALSSVALADTPDAPVGDVVFQATCPTPRPPVKVTVVPNGEGQLKVTVVAGFGFLRTIKFGALTNSRLIFPGDAQVQGGGNLQAGNFTIKPSDGATSFTFIVASTSTNGVQPINVPLTVVDDCGDWPTFVGGGLGALESNISIADAQITEGNSGTKPLTFTVTLAPASAGTVTVSFATADGTAKAGEDYVATSGTLSFAAGETSKPITVQINGDLTAEPDETFTVNLSNASGGFIADASAIGTIQNDDAAPATAPAAKDDSYVATVGQTLTVSAADGLLKNDSVGSPAASVTSFGGGTIGGSVTTNAAGSQVGLPNSGLLKVNADGSLSFTPPTSGASSVNFSYRLTGWAGSSDANVSIVVIASRGGPGDVAPTAVNDAATVAVNAAATAIDVLANDTDPDGGPKAVQSVTQPAHGTVVITGGGSGLTYAPTANYCNTQAGGTPDTFTYTLNGGSTATVSVTVTCAANVPPTADAQSVSTAANTAKPITLTASDPETCDLTFTIVAGPSHGTLSSPLGAVACTPGSPNHDSATVTYTPANNYSGPDSFTFKANDGTSDSATATVSISVAGLPATHFSVSAPANATAGTPANVTVTALDTLNNTATGYTGTVHFTSTDGAATLPANGTLTNGSGTVPVTFKTSGNQTVTATDTVTPAITGTSGTVAVSGGAATHFTVTAPAGATANVAFNFTVTAFDQFNNTATGYAGTLHFTSTDAAATLPADTTLTSGTGTFSATLLAGGSRTITATDTVTNSITGTSGAIVVTGPAATHFSVSAPAGVIAGKPFNVTVTALDAANVVATTYSGTVHFTTSDGLAVLPADATLTVGAGTFSVTLKTAGNQTITATDTVSAGITGTSAAIPVSAADATKFSVTAPAAATSHVAFNFTITAQDQFNNTAAGYAGTVHFTSSDALATLPADTTLGGGTGTFSATLVTGGNQTITGTDTATSSITGVSGNINVATPPATHYSVTVPPSATAGVPFNVTVTALDASNNQVNNYAGTVHFTSSDGAATLPADTTLTNGTGTFSVTLATVPSQTITAADLAAPFSNTSSGITVSAAAASKFSVTAPAGATSHVAFNFTVTAQDAFNNTATGYGGTVHFASSDSVATLPGDTTLAAGVGTFSATLVAGGAQTITATDTVSPGITGTSNTVTVTTPPATHYSVTVPPSATAGVPFNVTVTALDASNNQVNNYGGTVHFTTNDGGAGVSLPANSTLTNGTGSFSATLTTAGNRTITATDTVSAGITGTSASILVGAAAATHFSVVAPPTAGSGVAFNFTVTALDQFSNTATGYGGTVQFSSSDGSATLPSNITLTSGAGTFSATLVTSGTQTITATDTVTGSITGTSGNITVSLPAPVAVNDAYTATGNVSINVTTVAEGVLQRGTDDTLNGGTLAKYGKDTGNLITVDGTTSTVTTNGGTVLLQTNGTFIYDPPVGFTGADTFVYRLTNASGNGDGTVTITVSDKIWFINNTAGACSSACDGRLTHPFTTLGAFQTVNSGAAPHPQDGDSIFIYTGSSTYGNAVTLRASQKLIGQGATASIATITGITLAPFSATLPATSGTRPTVGGTVAMSNSSLARGFDISSVASNGMTGSSVSGLTVSEVGVTTTTGVAVNFTSVTGSTVSFSSVNAGTGASGPTSGIILSSSSGISVGGGTIQKATGDGIALTNVTGTMSLTNVTVTGSAGHQLHLAQSTGTLDALTITGGSYGNTSGANVKDGLFADLSGTGVVKAATISGATFSNNGKDGIEMSASGTSTLGDGVGASVGTPAAGTITVTSNTFASNLGSGLAFEQAPDQGSAQVYTRIINNTLTDNTTGGGGHIVLQSGSHTAGGTFKARIDGNQLNVPASARTANGGPGIGVTIQGKTVSTITVVNNKVRKTYAARGIDLEANGSTAASVPITTHSFVVTGNDVDNGSTADLGAGLSSGLDDIYVQADNQGSPAHLNAEIHGNTVKPATFGSSDYPTFDGAAPWLYYNINNAGGVAQLFNFGGHADPSTELATTNTGTTGVVGGVTLTSTAVPSIP